MKLFEKVREFRAKQIEKNEKRDNFISKEIHERNIREKAELVKIKEQRIALENSHRTTDDLRAEKKAYLKEKFSGFRKIGEKVMASANTKPHKISQPSNIFGASSINSPFTPTHDSTYYSSGFGSSKGGGINFGSTRNPFVSSEIKDKKASKVNRRSIIINVK